MAQVRRATVHRTRFACASVALAALAVLLTVTVTVWTPTGAATVRLRGDDIFAWLGRITALLAVGVVPLLTADSLSRERREGTLPLLFLTPLRPPAIVFGKTIHGLVQAALLFLSVLPILTVPVLAGGVSAVQLTATWLVLATLMLLGLASGLLASSLCERPGRALALAYVVEAGFCILGVGVGLAVGSGPRMAWRWLINPAGWLMDLGDRWNSMTFAPHSLGRQGILPALAGIAGPGGGGAPPGFGPQIGMFLAAILGLVGVLLLAARCIRRRAVSDPGSAALEARRRMWTEVRWLREWFRGRQRRNLERNPLVWLQRRTPAQSVQRLAWLGIAAVLWTNVVTGFSSTSWDPRVLALAVPFLLAGGMVFQAAGVLRAEREAGSIELLLVTGLTEGQLIRGAVRAAVGTFLPAVVLHEGVNHVLRGYWRLGEFPALMVPLLTSTVVLPLIGLDHGLRDGRYLRGLTRVTMLGLLTPVAVGVGWVSGLAWIGPDLGFGPGLPSASAVFSLVQGVLGLLAWQSARRCLAERTFLTAAVPG